MSYLDTRCRSGFSNGITVVTEPEDTTGIAFSMVRLQEGEVYEFQSSMELALLHLSGAIEVEYSEGRYRNERGSLFDDAPFAVHIPKEVTLVLKALSDCECAIFETKNDLLFPGRVYKPEDTVNEPRGKGLLGNTFFRYVRTIFDSSTSHINAKLVLGEVVNFPGRWSSYPPHHHPQPELYHYRFTDPKGYGHAEIGEEVYKVRQYDTLKIVDGKEHSQCSAPGYGMYYLWVIRHLEESRYEKPIFIEDHKWTLDATAAFWMPKDEGVLA